MNRIAFSLMVAWLTGSVAGCAQPMDFGIDPTPPATKPVAMIAKSKHSDYWNSVVLGAEAAAKEFQVELRVDAPDAYGDVPRQVELMNRAVSDGAGAIVLAPGHYESLDASVDQAVARGVPVITIETEVRSPKAAHIGIDHVEAGRKAAEKMVGLIGGHGNVAVVGLSPGDRSAELRTQGLREALAKHEQVNVTAAQHCSSEIQLCREVARGLLGQERSGLDGMIALDADAAVTIAKELLRLGLDGKVKLVAFDNAPEAVALMQDGIIHAMIIQNTFSMGYLSVKHAVEAMAGRQVPARTATEIKVIDLDNMLWPDHQKLLFPFVK